MPETLFVLSQGLFLARGLAFCFYSEKKTLEIFRPFLPAVKLQGLGELNLLLLVVVVTFKSANRTNVMKLFSK